MTLAQRLLGRLASLNPGVEFEPIYTPRLTIWGMRWRTPAGRFSITMDGKTIYLRHWPEANPMDVRLRHFYRPGSPWEENLREALAKYGIAF